MNTAKVFPVIFFPILNITGAMENWGLVIYREGALLIDEETSSAMRKEYVSLIVGHELAHNWFGNLVTLVRRCPT